MYLPVSILTPFSTTNSNRYEDMKYCRVYEDLVVFDLHEPQFLIIYFRLCKINVNKLTDAEVLYLLFNYYLAFKKPVDKIAV